MSEDFYGKLKGFIRMAKKADVGVSIPRKERKKSKYNVYEVIGPGGQKVGMLSVNDKKLPYHQLNERVVNDN